MSFWTEAFESLGDNLTITGAVAQDLAANLNPWSADFLSGSAKNTATVAEQQIAAREGREVDQGRIDRSAAGGLETIATGAKQTGAEVGRFVAEQATERLAQAGSVLDLVTNKWFLAAAGVVVVLVVAAPYAGPVLGRLR